MNVKQIVAQYLKAHGYDGLCTSDCGCRVEDLAPCAICPQADCVAGHFVGVPEDVDASFWIAPGKPGEQEKGG